MCVCMCVCVCVCLLSSIGTFVTELAGVVCGSQGSGLSCYREQQRFQQDGKLSAILSLLWLS